MPIIKNILRKGTARLQNLKDFDVFIDETGVVGSLASSQYFVISGFPADLPTGNSSFKIEGSNLLKPGVELKTEILDSQGNPIFHYPIPNYNKELPAQRVGIEVYNDIAKGTGFLYVLGELDPKKVDVPQEFQGIYNVRFTAPIIVDTEARNSQPIKFFGDPTISVTENVKGVIKRGNSFASEVTNTLSGSFIATATTHYPPISPPNDNDTFDTSFENRENTLVDTTQFENVGKSLKEYSGKFKNLSEGSSPGGVLLEKDEFKNVPNNTKPSYNVTYVLQSLSAGSNNAINKLSGVMNGAELRITNPHNLVDSTEFPDVDFEKPTSFTGSIGIVNDTTFFLQEDYLIRNKNTGIARPVSLAAASQYKIIYEGFTEPTEDTLIKKSFANITVGNLRTFSGDTYKSKIYMKEEGSAGGFEKIYDVVVEAPNQLVDQNSITGFKNVGSFHTQSNVENYWISSSTVTASQHSSTLVDGVLLSGSNYGAEQSFTFITSQSYSLEKNESYVVEFNTAFIKKNKLDSNANSTEQAELEVFLTGSALSTTDQEYSLGKVNSDFKEMDNKTSGSIQGVFNDFITHNRSSTPTTKLGFRVNAGQFVLQDVSLRPFSETNFSPGFFKANVPMPNPVKKGAKFDFLAEFYDANNNIAETAAIVENIEFQGAPLVIQGTDGNALSGSMLIGQSVEMYGTNPAYIRSVGYNGFDKTTAGTGTTKGGFLIWSGSIGDGATGGNRLEASEAYNGVGIEIVDAKDTSNKYNHSFFQFASNYKNSGNPRFRVQSNEFLLGVSGSGAAEAFISGSDGKLRISSSGFFLDTDGSINAGQGNFVVSSGGAVTLAGTITAAAGGTIGGFNIGTNDIFAGNAALNNANTKIVIGNTDGTPKIALGGTADSITLTSGNDGVFMDGNGDFRVGDANGTRIAFDQSAGTLILSSSDFMLGSKANGKSFISSSGGELEISSSFFHLSSSGHITGSKVLFDGGVVGGWTIGSTLSSTNILLDPSTPKITLGSKATLTDSNSGAYIGTDGIALGASSVFKVTSAGAVTAGNITATGGTVGGWTIGSTLSATNILLDPATPKITLGSKATLTDSNTGLYLGTDGIALGASSVFKVTSAGALTATSGEIGGFEINSTELKTSDFAPGVKGLRLTSANNGKLEVEEAVIRGTLRTAVFEKETINAVGGQLHIANSTTITGSAQVGTGDTKIQVANSSGFTTGEFIIAKKFNASGFSTEIMKITGVAHQDASHATNRSGSLTVLRAQGTSDPGTNSPQGIPDEAILLGVTGGTGASAQTYEPGQVLVSTGKENTGYIRLNANPNDTTTPYIDIIERNGTGVYDMDLKARLGDLSGISDTINGESVTGFGLYTDNAFLKGGIVASYGSIGGFNMSSTDLWAGNATIGNSGTKIVVSADSTPKIALSNASADGMSLTGGSDGFFVDGDGDFRVGDADGERISFDRSAQRLVMSSSTFMIGSKANGKSFISASDAYGLEISSSNFHLSASGKITASAVKLSGDITATTGNIGGFTIDSDEIKSTNLLLDSNNEKITVGSANAVTIQGGNPDNFITMKDKTTFGQSSNAGIILGMDATEPTLEMFKNATNNLTFNASGLAINTATFDLKTTPLRVSSSNGGAIGMGATAPTSLTAGDGIFMSGSGVFRAGNADGPRIAFDGTNIILSSSKFMLGSKGSSNSFISSSGNTLVISSSNFHISKEGDVTASNALISGKVTADDGDIAGWAIGSTSITKTTGTNLKTVQFDSNTPLVLIQSGSGGAANFNEIRMDANAGNIKVRQDGVQIFNTGNRIQPLQAQSFIVKSLPIASGNEFSTDAADLVPITEITHLSASSQIGTKNLIVDDTFRMKNLSANLSAKTPFYVSISDPLSLTKAVGSNATPIFFEVSRSYDTMTPAHEIGQSAVFSTVLNSNDDGGRFVGSSNTTGSAIYHFQTILTEASANHFDDAKLAHIRSDVDVHDLAAAQQKQFVHFDARTSSGSKHNQRVFQVQYDGDVVSAGNITAFGASSNFLNVSDKRLKKNIHTISESLDRILELRPTEFVWKENDKRDIGFIAQEVEEIIPEIVETSEGFLDTHTDDKSQDDVKTVSYSKLTPYLVDTIQELTKRIEELEKKVK
mgnify:CR=1 FL=1